MICLDSSVVAKLFLEENLSQQARALYQTLIEEETLIVAPSLLPIEITNIFHQRTRLVQAITADEAIHLFDDFLVLPIEILNPPGLHRRALHLAGELGLPATYDAHYLALAEILECEFWTADQRLERQSARRLPLVRWLGDFGAE